MPIIRKHPRLFAAAAFSLSLLAALASCSRGGASADNDPAVIAFLHRYFDTWSARDMDGYGHCFADQARISYIGPNGEIITQGVTDFLHGQRLAHDASSVPMTERPVEMKIQGDDRVKQAAVTWVLNKDGGEKRGTDFFTLDHNGADWRIVSLVFYAQ